MSRPFVAKTSAPQGDRDGRCHSENAYFAFEESPHLTVILSEVKNLLFYVFCILFVIPENLTTVIPEIFYRGSRLLFNPGFPLSRE
jgi:hypothetical protein